MGVCARLSSFGPTLFRNVRAEPIAPIAYLASSSTKNDFRQKNKKEPLSLFLCLCLITAHRTHHGRTRALTLSKSWHVKVVQQLLFARHLSTRLPLIIAQEYVSYEQSELHHQTVHRTGRVCMDPVSRHFPSAGFDGMPDAAGVTQQTPHARYALGKRRQRSAQKSMIGLLISPIQNMVFCFCGALFPLSMIILRGTVHFVSSLEGVLERAVCEQTRKVFKINERRQI